MTRSQRIIKESRKIVEEIKETQPALSKFLKLLTDEYEIAIKQNIKIDQTLHDFLKGDGQ